MNYYIFLDISPLRGEISKSHAFVHTKIRDIKIDFKIKNVALVKVPIGQESVVMGGIYKIIKDHFLLTRGTG